VIVVVGAQPHDNETYFTIHEAGQTLDGVFSEDNHERTQIECIQSGAVKAQEASPITIQRIETGVP
jgi:hypothetical protein